MASHCGRAVFSFNRPTAMALAVEGRLSTVNTRWNSRQAQKKVHITGLMAKKYNMNNPEEARFSKAAADRGNTSGTYDCADPTIANAKGNLSSVEVKAGIQTFDFALQRTAVKTLKKAP